MFCPNCGTKISDDSNFCMNCGCKINPGNVSGVDYKQPNQVNNNYVEAPAKKGGGCLKVFLAIVCVIILLVGMLIIIIIPHEENVDDYVNEDSSANEAIEEIQEPEISEEDYKKSCEVFSYEEISRNPDIYKGKLAFYTGEVVQVQEYVLAGLSINYYRVNVTKVTYEYSGLVTYTDTIYVEYNPKEGESRILEGDIVNVWGEMDGLESYTSVAGYDVTIPRMHAEYIEIAE